MEERYFLLHFCAIFFMAENIVHISQMTIALLLMWKLFAYLFAREFIVFSVICTTVFAVIHIPLKYIAYFFVFLFYFHSTIFLYDYGWNLYHGGGFKSRSEKKIAVDEINLRKKISVTKWYNLEKLNLLRKVN